MRWVGQLTIDELHPFNVKEFWCSNPEKQTLIDETLLLVHTYNRHIEDTGACATVRISKNFAGKWKF